MSYIFLQWCDYYMTNTWLLFLLSMTCQDMTASPDVKDNWGMMSNSMKQQSMATFQVISLQQYAKSPYIAMDTTNYK